MRGDITHLYGIIGPFPSSSQGRRNEGCIRKHVVSPCPDRGHHMRRSLGTPPPLQPHPIEDAEFIQKTVILTSNASQIHLASLIMKRCTTRARPRPKRPAPFRSFEDERGPRNKGKTFVSNGDTVTLYKWFMLAVTNTICPYNMFLQPSNNGLSGHSHTVSIVGENKDNEGHKLFGICARF